MNNMNLREHIRKVLREETEIPLNIRRRIPILNNLINVLLSNSYPCDFFSEDHFIEGILYDLDTYLITFELEGLTSEEILKFAREYYYTEMRRYYIDSQEDC